MTARRNKLKWAIYCMVLYMKEHILSINLKTRIAINKNKFR